MSHESVRTLVVTGASRGIGASVARLASSRGYSVAVNYQSNENAARKLVEEIRSAGGSAISIRGDVGVEADIIRLFEVAEQMLVEALVTKAAFEALDEAILHRFARRDVVPFDAMLLLPSQDGI